jgi:hypothetical protein
LQETGASTYHALQVRLQKAFANGLSYLVTYTLSKNLSAGGMYPFATFNAGPLDTYNRKLEKGLDTMDQTHIVRASGVYELPIGPTKRYLPYKGVAGKILGGWEIAWFVSYSSGTPMGIGGGNPVPLFNGQTRPDVVAGVAQKGSWSGKFDPAVDLYLNAGAWTQNAPFTFGNSPYTQPSLRYFAGYNENFSLIKRTQIWESVNFEVRGEAFNLFNRTIYGGPDATVGSAGFGVIGGQANAPRVVQMTAKFNF